MERIVIVSDLQIPYFDPESRPQFNRIYQKI
jgi:hypothetical protein